MKEVTGKEKNQTKDLPLDQILLNVLLVCWTTAVSSKEWIN